MSLFSSDINRPKTIVRPESGTTSKFQRSFLLDFGMRYIQATINNLDITNSLLIKVNQGGVDITIPPNSQAVISDEIHQYFEANPDSVTGKWEARFQLVETRELQRLGLL